MGVIAMANAINAPLVIATGRFKRISPFENIFNAPHGSMDSRKSCEQSFIQLHPHALQHPGEWKGTLESRVHRQIKRPTYAKGTRITTQLTYAIQFGFAC